LFEVGEQGNAESQSISLLAVHAGLISGIRIRLAALQSQASRVGEANHPEEADPEALGAAEQPAPDGGGIGGAVFVGADGDAVFKGADW